MKDHRLIDERSLALGRLIAKKLSADAALVQLASANIKRWLETASAGARPALLEWMQTLEGPLSGVMQLLEGTDPRSVRLRQSNPFAGALNANERLSVFKEFEVNEPVTA